MTIKELRPVTEQTSDRKLIIGYDTDNIDILKSLALRLDIEASYYMKIYKRIGQVLWRGIGFTGAMAYESKSVTNRTPMNSRVKYTQMFDDALRDLGFKAVRSNSIFATGNIEQAKSYGDTYAIVPKNSAKFTWSQTSDDLVINHRVITSLYKKDSDEEEIDLDEFERVYEFDQRDFSSAVRSGNEVMISGEYFAIHPKLWNKLVDLNLLPENLSTKHLFMDINTVQ